MTYFSTLNPLGIGQEFEDTKGVTESVNRRRTDNIMAKK
jgi:hypothetical protein